jgi:hypothetical protein
VTDIETSVAITARTDGLQSGMAAAANAVGTATGAMRAQLGDLGNAAQQTQADIGAAAAQIGSTLSALQARTARLAGSFDEMRRSSGILASGNQAPGISVRQQAAEDSGGSASRLQAWREELHGRLNEEQSFFDSSKAEELAFWQDKLASTEAGSKEQLAVENNIYELERQLAVRGERDALASLAAGEKTAESVYARKKAAIAEQSALGRISSAEATAQLQDALDSQWALEQDYYQRKLAAAQSDTQTQKKLSQEQDLAYQKYLNDKEALDARAVESSQQQWQSLAQPIERVLDTSITGIITGTSTVQKGLANLAQAVVGEFVGSGVASIFGALGTLLSGGIASLGGSANQDFSGGLAGAGGQILSAGISGDVFGAGGMFGASGLGGLSSGGIFGSLFKGIGSLFGFERGGIVPSAAGGWIVPNTSLAMLHTNEMVLPAGISQGLQNMIAGGSTSPPNVTFAVSAMDAQSVATFFKNNGATLVTAINQAMRNGSALRSS